MQSILEKHQDPNCGSQMHYCHGFLPSGFENSLIIIMKMELTQEMSLGNFTKLTGEDFI